MQECVKCMLPAGKWNVTLNEDGTCNLCRHWQENKERITDYETNSKLLIERLNKLRKSDNQHNALLGFSGGKDSTYIAYTLAHKYGIKPLLMTYDNGFLNEYARQNIQTVIQRIGLDHFFHSFDPAIQQAFYRSSLAVFGDPCIACTVPGYYFHIKYAYENRIPMIFHGRTPFQIFRNYYPESKDIFIELHETNYHPHSFERLAEVYSLFSDSLKQLLKDLFPDDKELQDKAYNAIFFDVESAKPEELPDFIGLFQYEEYDEESIKKQMEEAIGYKRPKGDITLGHGDCDLHTAIANLYYLLHGEVSTATEISAMIRHGVLTKNQAIELKDKYQDTESRRQPGWTETLCQAASLSTGAVDEIITNLSDGEPKQFHNH
ncbi:MAG: hypothetical protein D3911_12520 [Candidatus Electrothrix sp. AW3_4]|nr:hypothetical protein [Candidatus Electrothrix gigas]